MALNPDVLGGAPDLPQSLGPAPDVSGPTAMPQQAQAAPEPAKPSGLKGLLAGALQGLAIGLQGESTAAHNKRLFDQEQKAAETKRLDTQEADQHTQAQAQLANTLLTHQQLALAYQNMPKTAQEALDRKEVEFVQDLKTKYGITPVEATSQDDAYSKAKALNEQYAAQNDHFSRAIPVHTGDGKWGVVTPPNTPNREPLEVTLADGTKQPVPANTLTGIDFLKNSMNIATQVAKNKVAESKASTPDDIEAAAQDVLAGNRAPSQLGKKNGFADKVLNRVRDISGGAFNATSAESQYQAKKAVLKDATSGKTGTLIRSFGVADQHLGQLDELAEALGNGNNTKVNELSQKYSELTGGTAPNSFDAVKNIAVGEVVKLVTNGNISESELEKVAAPLNRAKTLPQLRDAIGQMRHLMQAQKSGLENQVTQGLQGKVAFTNPNQSKPAAPAKKRLVYNPATGKVE